MIIFYKDVDVMNTIYNNIVQYVSATNTLDKKGIIMQHITQYFL